MLKLPRHSRATQVLLLFALLAGLVALMDRLLAGPARRWAERTINSHLDGYHVRIIRAKPQFWRLALTLEGVVLEQQSHPDPPVADIGALRFTLLPHELLRFKVAGNLTLDHPDLHMNLDQIEAEAKSKKRLQDRGWQEAVESIFPFKLNRVEIRQGSLLYLSSGTESKPLQLTRVDMEAQNIRNIRAVAGTYPSPVSLDGVLFDIGRIQFRGASDFLREPHAAAQGKFSLERVPLDRLDPLGRNVQVTTSGGYLSARGWVEYTPESQEAHITDMLLEDLSLDYATSAATRARELERARVVAAAAKRVSNKKGLLLRVDVLRLAKARLGFVNQSAKPPYRVFLSGVQMELRNLSNQASQGRSTFRAQGAFMGTGTTRANGGYQQASQPDFDLHLHMEDTDLTRLNPLLLADTGVDVAGGTFSVFAELTGRDGKVDGYIKPLFKDLKIYDRAKDKRKPFGKRVELHVLQLLAGLFKNSSTKQVATVTHITGSTEAPHFSTWETIRELLRNGLIQAIRPGFLGTSKEDQPPPPAPKAEPNR